MHLFHQWTLWSEPYVLEVIYRGYLESFDETVQDRTCETCGKLERREVKVYG